VTTGLDDLDGPVIVARWPTVYLDADSGMWPEQVELRMALPPKLAELGAPRARRMLRAELERQLAEARAHVREEGWKVLGAASESRPMSGRRAESRCAAATRCWRPDGDFVSGFARGLRS